MGFFELTICGKVREWNEDVLWCMRSDVQLIRFRQYVSAMRLG